MSVKQIMNEREAAKKYKLVSIEDAPRLVALTEDNVARVEAMIQTDSNYRTSLEDKEKSPYWIQKMNDFLTGKRDYKFEEIIGKIVELLDNENSTHLNADGCGREVIKNRILHREKEIWESLENRECGFKLINILSERTKQGKGGRCNISFASKFCHFSCFYIFEKEEAQDNFSIYDGVVAGALPAYLDYYKEKLDTKIDLKTIKKEIKNKNYREYSKAIDVIIKASGSKISRNGFDHLVWYYFKGNDVSVI